MDTDVFTSIRERVNILDAAARYGVQVNRHGKALCFAHDEKTPSMSFKDNRFKCFACGVGGSVIDLVSLLQGITPLESARQLDHDYGLNLFTDRELTPQERKEAAADARKRESDKLLVQAFQSWWDETWHTVIWYHWHLKDEWERLRPRSMDDEISTEFAHVLHETGKIEYMLDCLMASDEGEKIDFYATWRERVKAIELYRKSREFTGAA